LVFGFDRINSAEVLVNDPDNMPGHADSQGQATSIGTVEQAMTDVSGDVATAVLLILATTVQPACTWFVSDVKKRARRG
jgi:hypothetical protein